MEVNTYSLCNEILFSENIILEVTMYSSCSTDWRAPCPVWMPMEHWRLAWDMEAGVGSLLSGHREIHLPTVIFKDVNRPTSLCGGYGLSIPPQSLLPCDNTFVPPAWPQDSSEIATSSFYIANQFSISIVMSQKKHVLKRLSLPNMPREEGQKTILFI